MSPTAPYLHCVAPKQDLRICGRKARYAYLDGDRYVAAYCAQHYRNDWIQSWHTPRVWDYQRIVDVVAHVTVLDRVAG